MRKLRWAGHYNARSNCCCSVVHFCFLLRRQRGHVIYLLHKCGRDAFTDVHVGCVVTVLDDSATRGRVTGAPNYIAVACVCKLVAGVTAAAAGTLEREIGGERRRRSLPSPGNRVRSFHLPFVPLHCASAVSGEDAIVQLSLRHQRGLFPAIDSCRARRKERVFFFHFIERRLWHF